MDFPNLPLYDVVALDTETTGTNWQTDRVFGVSVSLPDGQDFYWDIRETPEAVRWLRDQLPQVRNIVNHNLKFDAHMLANEIAWMNLSFGRCNCSMLNACLIDEHLREYNLDFLGGKYLGEHKHNEVYDQLAELFGGKPTRAAQIGNLHHAPSRIVAPYAMQDTRLALRLWQWQQEEMKRQDLKKVHDLEYRLYPYVFRMERNGIRINVDEARQTKERLLVRAKELNRQINEIAGFPVNPNPSDSIRKLFNPKQNAEGKWVCEDGTVVPSTEAGKPSLGADQLRAMTHPAAALILNCRKLIKTANTFIEAHVLERLHNGRVHANINQTKGDNEDGGREGTSTGRLSYTRPALQQIPSRDKTIAEIVRPIFLPEEGHGWTYGDLDQHEYRVFAHYSNAPSLIKAYADNPDIDIHQTVADLTGLPRSAGRSGQPNAKQVNLGMVFCMGGGTLAEKMNLPFTVESFTDARGQVHEYKKAGPEAEEIMERYYTIVPGVKEVARKAQAIAKSRGYVMTMDGRHIRFPGGQFLHKASGLIYQGTSAGFNKECCCRIVEYLDSECPDSRLLLNIHDEFNISMPHDSKFIKHLEDIKYLIEDRPELRVPIRVDFSTLAENWWKSNISEHATGHGWSHAPGYKRNDI